MLKRKEQDRYRDPEQRQCIAEAHVASLPAAPDVLPNRARERAGIEGYVRPSHDLRHSSITNAARAGTMPEALMARAGHSSYATTRRYIDLAGARFRDEADLLEERLFGAAGTKRRYQDGDSSPEETTPEPANQHE